MSRQQILERERRWAPAAGIAAIAAAPLLIASLVIDQSGAVPIDGVDTERYRLIDANSTELLGSAVLRALAFLVVCVPLIYLFRAAQARSTRVSAAMLGFAFIGPILLAAQAVIAWVAETGVASDFLAQSAPGGDIYTLLDDLLEDSTAFDVASNLLFPAILGMLVAMIYVPLQAMRVGLLTRFFATLGMALGVGMLFIVPAFALLVITLWFLYLGVLILDRLPRGRPPAWGTGEAIPWPKAGEEPAERPGPESASGTEVVEGEATEVAEGEPRDQSARRERARKRKRKQRRR